MCKLHYYAVFVSEGLCRIVGTFMDCLKQIIGGCGMPPNFMEKTFADGTQTSKSVKVFSLESFPLYGKCLGKSNNFSCNTPVS